MGDFALAMNNEPIDPAPPLNQTDVVEVYLVNVTSSVGDDLDDSTALLPIEFVVVLVLAAACVIVGVVYTYVHITRAARARVEKHKRRPSSFGGHHHHHHVNRDTSVDEGSRQTHLMFFRRSATT